MEVRPPQSCSAQELVNELVRRALEDPDMEAIRKDVADAWWVKMEKSGPRRGTKRK